MVLGLVEDDAKDQGFWYKLNEEEFISEVLLHQVYGLFEVK